MNRRLMMTQQNKGFELIYDAASGTLPTEQGWSFDYWIYGQVNNKIGIQTMENNVLNVCVGHVYENCSYVIADKPIAKNCEISVTVDNTIGLTVSSKMGILLTDGEKAIELVYRIGGSNNGIMHLTNNANERYSGYKWINWGTGIKTNFTLSARLEGGVVSVWLNDKLMTTISDLYDVSEIYTGITHTNAGNPWHSGGTFLFENVRNSVAFATEGTYLVTQLTYKEW